MIFLTIIAYIAFFYYWAMWRKDHGEDYAENFNRLTPEMKDENYYGFVVSSILCIIFLFASIPELVELS